MKHLIKELYSSNSLHEISRDLIEVLIDSTIENSILKQLPIIKLIHTGSQFIGSIQDRLFLQKILYTFYEIKHTTLEDRERVAGEIEDEYTDGIDKIMNTINSFNDNRKAIIYGRLLGLKIRNEITLNEFEELSYIISKCFLPHLMDYGSKSRSHLDSEARQRYVNLGLIYEPKSGKLTDINSSKRMFRITKIGKKLNSISEVLFTKELQKEDEYSLE